MVLFTMFVLTVIYRSMLVWVIFSKTTSLFNCSVERTVEQNTMVLCQKLNTVFRFIYEYLFILMIKHFF